VVTYCKTHDTASPYHRSISGDPCRLVDSTEILDIMHAAAATEMHRNGGGCSLRHALKVAWAAARQSGEIGR
jgi:hypothetical protein